jgi:hypothetical protein
MARRVEKNLTMTQRVKDSISFLTMTVLVFIGSHFLLLGSVSTGPHLYLDLGWLQLHRYGQNWSVESVSVRGLVAVILCSFLFTWFFSKALRRRIVNFDE